MDQANPVITSTLQLNKQEKLQLKMTNPELVKRYVCLITFSENMGWFWSTSDDLDEAKSIYRSTVNQLKEGMDVEFIDLANRKKPFRLSWRGIEFQW